MSCRLLSRVLHDGLEFRQFSEVIQGVRSADEFADIHDGTRHVGLSAQSPRLLEAIDGFVGLLQLI